MQRFLLRLRVQYTQCFILGSGVDGWGEVGRSAPSKTLYPLLWMLATFWGGGGEWKEEQTQSLTRVTKALAIPLAQRE